MNRFALLVIVALLASIAVPVPEASAQTAQAREAVVDGEKWLASSAEVRKAFLLGAGNMIALEIAYAQRKSIAVSAASERTRRAIEPLTLDQLSDRITRWYQAHPDRRHMPVMAVVWLDVVGKPAP